MGYKRRNARLDHLTENPPKYLADSKVVLTKENFAGTDDEAALNEVYAHLHEQFNLLSNVIEARRLHHSRFFSVELDYGHQVFIDNLMNRKFHVERALERLTRRTAQVLYQKQKWFEWAQDCQKDEESNRLSEKVKVQRENAMFKRHAKELEARLAHNRSKEAERKQDLFLDEAYRARLAEEDIDIWDPIQDTMEDLRANYVDLIRHFLWLPAPQMPQEPEIKPVTSCNMTTGPAQVPVDAIVESNEAGYGGKKKKKRRPQSKAQSKVQVQVNTNVEKPPQQPDKKHIETLDELRDRLSQSTRISDLQHGPHLAGTVDTPMELWNRTAPMTATETDSMIDEMKEVKLFIFCRLLLSHAVLLPIALESDSVEAFLFNPAVLDKDLRELCLKMEQPDLQIVRDACADLGRSEEEAQEDEEDVTETDIAENRSNSLTKILVQKDVRIFENSWRDGMPRQWHSSRREERKKRFKKLKDEGQTFTDFGIRTDNKEGFQRHKVRVKVCGHWIWNYASDSELKRSGWLLFSMMTNCSLFKATQLCRSWSEFFELSILTIFNYFPTSFRNWVGDHFKQQLLMMGFMPYMIEANAEDLTVHRQTGARSQAGRQHMFFEARPFLCGQMRRNDPVTRRFVQYLSMMSNEVLVLARDGKTGKILLQPHKDQRWLKRGKSGIGRAAKNKWTILQSVGPRFFEEMDAKRTWSLSFDDYYDVYVWALEAGENFQILCSAVHDTLWKARRITEPKQAYDHMAPILSTITRDKVTLRARDIKPNESVESIFDEITAGEVRVGSVTPGDRTGQYLQSDPEALRKVLYTEADALEDAVLFPDELVNGEASGIFEKITSSLLKYEEGGPSLARWAVGAEFDEEMSDYLNDSEEEFGRLRDYSEGDSEDYDEDDIDDGSSIDTLKSSAKAELDLPTGGTSERVWEVKDPAKAELASTKLRGTKHGWENALTAIMVADAKDSKSIDPAVVTWLGDMFEYEENVLDIPKDPFLAKAKFIGWMERERSQPFKEMFHNADPSPFDQQWKESMELVKLVEAWEIGDAIRGSFVIAQLVELKVRDASRSQYRQMVRAFAQMSLFFPDHKVLSMEAFLKTNDVCEKYRSSLLFDPAARAKMIPQCRSLKSNWLRPKEFWDEYYERVRDRPGDHAVNYPREWDTAVRPIIAKLYKEGVICPAYTSAYDIESQAIAAKEPGSNELDLFIYYAFRYKESAMSQIEHPSKWPDIKAECRTFAENEPNARYALLKVFSTPYFWPLMIGYENRGETAFNDSIGRSWHWKFIPKDFSGSERSMHHSVQLSLGKAGIDYNKGQQVRVRRDVILVLGKDEEDLAKLAMHATYSLQGAPWIREVDLWKSFVNVDLEFVENLDKYWVE